MSLINDMLKDLEERRGGNQDRHEYFEGLKAVNEAFRPANKKKRYLLPLGFGFVVMLIVLIIYPGMRQTTFSANTTPEYEFRKIEPVSRTRADSSDWQTEKMAPAHASTKDIQTFSLRMDNMLSVAMAENTISAKAGKNGQPDRHEDVETETETSQPNASSRAEIRGITLNSTDSGISADILLSEKTDYKIYTLREPDRVVVEIEKSSLRNFDVDAAVSPMITSLRKGAYDDHVKLVFDLVQPLEITNERLESEGDGYMLSFRLRQQESSNNNMPGRIAKMPASNAMTQSPPKETKRNHAMEKTPRSNNAATIADKHYREGLHAYRQGKFNEAVEALTQALQLVPDNERMRHLLANAYLKMRQAQQAAAVLEQGIKLSPDSVHLKMLYARFLQESGQTNEAVSVLNISRPEIKQEPEYHALLAALHQDNDEYNESAAIYRELVQHYPEKGVWWMGLGISLEKNKQPDEAIQAYRQALQKGTLSSSLQQYVTRRLESLTSGQRT